MTAKYRDGDSSCKVICVSRRTLERIRLAREPGDKSIDVTLRRLLGLPEKEDIRGNKR